MADFLYFTEIVGLKVYDLKGRRIGRIEDAALVPLIDPVRVDRYLVGGGWTWLTVRWDQIRSISLDGVHLREEILTPYHEDEYMLRIARDLLDQQIIDVNGRKVVRVNDVTFEIRREPENEILRVLEVDVGLRSFLRRLLQGWVPRRWIRAIQRPIAPNSIRWEFCDIIEPDPQRRLRLNISHQKLEALHPADLADIVEVLTPEEREAIFEAIDSEVAAETLSEVEPRMQASILESLATGKAAEIIEEMAPDQAADVLAELEEETSEGILGEMDVEPKTEVRELLEYDEDTAGGMMNTEYVALHQRATVADAMEAIRGAEDLLENLNTLFLVDEEGKLAGAVPIGRLFVAGSETPVAELAAGTLIKVTVREKRDRVTEIFDKYNILTLPVVDEEDNLVGIITADDIISVLRQK
ncbi:MAG TPA: CBS domain-containing protein [Bryobacteraceae bacterium]|nr:CBS domain-containing protein [Bryobacteraceae bacterium]HOQ44151.1 CBS domain-containing protein [Bryobacteraceae bacterium]HPU70469.1 CBS domain-containing protein [Bryobacteraceae bacterium]